MFAGTDACVAPVLSMGELKADPQLAARQTIVDVDGAAQPHPAPRFSHTPTGPVRAAGPPVALEVVQARWSTRRVQ